MDYETKAVPRRPAGRAQKESKGSLDAAELADGTTGPVIVEEMGDVDAAEEIAQAYTVVKDVDVLDISQEGERLWTQAEAWALKDPVHCPSVGVLDTLK